jgi:hypothetical protein
MESICICGLILRCHPGIRLEGLRKTTKTSVKTAGLRVHKFEPGTFRLQSWSVNHSITTSYLSNIDSIVK